MNKPTRTTLVTLARRQWLAGAAIGAIGAIGALGSLGGCGFQLRRGYDMAFKTVQLTGFAGNSPLAAELARALEASGVNVVGSTLEAVQAASASSVPSTHIVIEGLTDRRDRRATTTTAYGQIRDMAATTVLRFQIKRGDGSVLLAPADVVLSSSMTYNEKDALAKQNEFDALHLAMQTDIVKQVMRRLAAIKPAQLIDTSAR